jgi:CRISPR-associated endoribonuclease Cas6
VQRIRIQLSSKKSEYYQFLDILHDAIVNAWTAAGAMSEQVTGINALPWNFAALGGQTQQRDKTVHTLIVSTPNTELAKILVNFNSADIQYARASTIEMVNFSEAQITIEDDPILPNQNVLGVLMLSPLLISDKTAHKKRWHKHLEQCDLTAAINHRLTRIAGRDVQLQIQPDSLYLRRNSDHSVFVPMKQMPNGKTAFVIGMTAPLVLTGNDDDLRLAWYTGIGEKTRNGFGCIGLAEQGIGR